ncbi:MAG: hypothetical protein IH804_09640 [Planctomycetes bacterium]|nr:hypothetical protein [Planctomycetota bacterium]
MARRRVAITGLGCVTPIGEGADGLWSGLQRRRSGIAPITFFDASLFRTRIAAEVPNFDVADRFGAKRARRIDRYSALALTSTSMALDDADLDPGTTLPERVAVQMGSALGGVTLAESEHAKYMAGGIRAVNPMLALSVFGGAASCNIAIEYGFTGPNSTNAMSCASGAIAIGHAYRLIRDGEADVALAGGAEAPLSPLSFGAFAILRAMSTRNGDPERACRPFDRERDGFVMGEGAAVLVLEELGGALRRNARIYAEIRGFGTTIDGYHMTAPLPDGRQAARAMELALLGDRLRVDFNAVDENVFYRSLAITNEDYSTLPGIIELIGGAGFDKLIIETVGAGQNETRIREHVDNTAVVVVPGMGDAVQMDKAGILEIADEFVINKADFSGESKLKRELLDIAAGRPIYETIATQGQGVVDLLDGLFG